MSRRLATVRMVTELAPIPDADLIELAIVDGWQCVVKKGEFRVGALGVYFEIDSFLPASDPRYKFLEPRFVKWQDKVGARIKTMRLRGQISQGLLLPVTDFPEIDLTQFINSGVDIAEQDYTDLLGIEKWEKPLPSSLDGVARGNFPSFIPKTDEERVQNIRGLFDKWGHQTFQETIKMDGSSMTVYYVAAETDVFAQNAKAGENGVFPDSLNGVCSRNLDLVETEGNLFWQTARTLGVLGKLAALGRSLAIQGELCGSSIQGNFEKFAPGEHNFFVYKVWDIEARKYWSPQMVKDLATDFGLQHVPINGYFVLNEIAKTTNDLVARADGTGINGAKREGLVFKHVKQVDDGLESFSFKAISNSYLLKHDE